MIGLFVTFIYHPLLERRADPRYVSNSDNLLDLRCHLVRECTLVYYPFSQALISFQRTPFSRLPLRSVTAFHRLSRLFSLFLYQRAPTHSLTYSITRSLIRSLLFLSPFMKPRLPYHNITRLCCWPCPCIIPYALPGIRYRQQFQHL